MPKFVYRVPIPLLKLLQMHVFFFKSMKPKNVIQNFAQTNVITILTTNKIPIVLHHFP